MGCCYVSDEQMAPVLIWLAFCLRWLMIQGQGRAARCCVTLPFSALGRGVTRLQGFSHLSVLPQHLEEVLVQAVRVLLKPGLHLALAPCLCRPLETVAMVQMIEFLPPTWEIQTEALAPNISCN